MNDTNFVRPWNTLEQSIYVPAHEFSPLLGIGLLHSTPTPSIPSILLAGDLQYIFDPSGRQYLLYYASNRSGTFNLQAKALGVVIFFPTSGAILFYSINLLS